MFNLTDSAVGAGAGNRTDGGTSSGEKLLRRCQAGSNSFR